MDNLIPQDAASSFFDRILSNPIGFAIVCIVVLLVILVPIFYKWIYPVMKESKASKLEEVKINKELNDSIKSLSDHLPEIDNQIISLSTEVASLKELKNGWETSISSLGSKMSTLQTSVNQLYAKSEKDDRELDTLIKHTQQNYDNINLLNNTMQEIQSGVKRLSEKSDNGDAELNKMIHDTRDSIEKITKSTNKVESDMAVLFESENNEFRIMLTQAYEKYVTNHEQMPRSVRQSLRIKFADYERRNGNGWAKELYLELMGVPENKE